MLFFWMFSLFIVSCKEYPPKGVLQETMTSGETMIVVDETIAPIVEDQVAVFQNEYDAKIQILKKPENEVIKLLFSDSVRIAVLTRSLSEEELKWFEIKKRIPRITNFATDAIALIVNKKEKDTIINIEELIGFMKGKPSNKIDKLVFDSPGSSTFRLINEIAGITIKQNDKVYSFNTPDEVIQYIYENDKAIGIIGVNNILQPSLTSENLVSSIKVLAVNNFEDNTYYKPTQSNIALGKYPLERKLYLINNQGISGLGMGFASFILSDRGQRIVLKSGLYPVQTPSREIQIVR